MKIHPIVFFGVLSLLLLTPNTQAATLYVDLNSANPTPPFSDWSTAATKIQDAVDAASSGDLVLVTNGVYRTGGRVLESPYGEPLTNTVVVDKPLTVQSVNGSTVTIIEGMPAIGDSAVRCVSLADNATLSGFTLKNGGTAASWPWGWDMDNISVQSGGGVYAEGPGAIVTNCIITGCSAYVWGGGAANGILKNCTLTNNSAVNNGGGANHALLENCSLLNNQCGGTGGGANDCTLNHCVLTANSAAQNGGGAENSTLNNCTLTFNTVPAFTTAAIGGGADSCTLNNCIVYYNIASAASTGSNYSSSTLNYCCTIPLPDSGTNNIADEPQLTDFAHVSADSPCIGAGSSNYVTGTDIDGELWMNPPSIGCDEYYSSATGTLSVAILANYTNVANGFSVELTAAVFGHASDISWDFGDGILASNKLSVQHAWLSGGNYSVTLTAYNQDYPSGISTMVEMHVFENPVHYVSMDSMNPTPPYVSWNTAATNIQDAVDAAIIGGTVLVSNGIYNVGGRAVVGSMTNRVAVNKPVTVSSINGPLATMIEGFTTNDYGSNIRCVYLTGNAALIGFTLTNGATIDGGYQVPEYYGAGVWCESAGVLVSNCVFVNNTATGDGGGAFGGSLFNCTFTNNFGSQGGAASGSRLYNCSIFNNRSYYGGGLINSTLTGCSLTGNFTYLDSDYVASGGGAANSTLTSCVLANNRSNSGGGASGCTLVNCALTANVSDGVYNAGGGGARDSTLVNCTVFGNSSAHAGGGGVLSSVLTNCIVYFNNASTAPNFSDDSSFYFCDTSPLPANGANNITNNPLFADSLHISATSPCRSAGDPAAASGTDIDGDAWLNPPSIGADEFNPASATGALAVAVSEDFTNVASGFTVNLAGQVSGHAAANTLDFGDGTMVSNQLFASHSWSTPGNYTVTFTAYNADNPGGVSAAATIFILQNPVHHVALDSVTPVAPFLTWATAATNIQGAIDAAFAGGTIIVSNGVYSTGSRMISGPNRVAVTKPLALQSVNGAAATVIDGGGAMRCLYLTNHVSVTGFTLRNGNEVNGAGVYCLADDVLNYCALAGNSAPGGRSYGGGVYGGVLNHCMLTGNSAGYFGGGAAYAVLNFCVLSNNSSASYGGAADHSTLNSCLVVSNSATFGGGVIYCEANNCLLLGNRVTYAGGGGIWSTLNGCTVVGNYAPLVNPGGYLPFSGAGIYGYTANNCIIYYNNGANYSGPTTLNYCCTTPNPGGSLNVATVPQFMNLAGSDFHLQSNSPCINSGKNGFVSGTSDFDGLVRIVGGTVDIGAYELQTPNSILSYAWAQQYGLATDGSADTLDSDGDGMNNFGEWKSGTSPTNALSVLQLSPPVFTNSPDGVVVTWQGVANVTYYLQRSSDLSGTFITLHRDIVGEAGTTSYTDTAATTGGPYFYRVGVQ